MASDGLPSGFFQLSQERWHRGTSVHVAAGGAAWLWACGAPSSPLLVLLPDGNQVRDFLWNAESLWPDVGRLHLEEPSLTGEGARAALLLQRGETLSRWHRGGGLLVASPGALMAPYSVHDRLFPVARGEAVGRETLLRWLQETGYERVDLVWAPGQFVVRGSIVDLFDPAYRLPLRLEFFDDDIESLRSFRPEDQRSVATFDRLELHGIHGRSGLPPLEAFFPAEARLLLCDPAKIETQAEAFSWLWSRLAEEESLPPLLPWLDLAFTLGRLPRIRIEKDLARSALRRNILPLPSFRGRWRDVEASLVQWSSPWQVTVFSRNAQVLLWARERGCRTVEGSLSNGFQDLDNRIVCLTDTELLGLSTPPSGGRSVPREWSDQIHPGQWVIHEDYGLGRFLGVERVDVSGGTQEHLALQFAEDRRLLIPTAQIDRLTPHHPAPGEEPEPDDLRRRNWKKAVERSRESAQETARALLEIYAKRETLQGFAFPPDDALQEAFESSFPYVETNDQLRAIDDVKRDMERPVPMDRLIVGDVGYGKTEVALRAAFKAVLAGKQVALLVPTTLLAQQHQETFSGRLGPFGVEIGLLSRFVTTATQRKIIADTAEGKIDILIGTHRLVQKDVDFRDLGLLIVDEEHRFGVLHKERLKERFPHVDVLTLTATPIPRTLHLSLGGIRDISLISTPPRDRHPVITVAGPWRDDLVRRAVARELARGGQVFFVHNRVRTIGARAEMLRRLFPESRLSVAHGQMAEGPLERTVAAFVRGESDILVCTTIVESGLDIARANTLIVDDAQDLGLAQMYQLRGRVGRRSEQAFALFLYPDDKEISRESRERLEAIAEIADLGTGYRLSLRDLEIRGGGEIIGTSQHGHGADRVGYLYYYKMLEEEIARLKGEERRETVIEVRIPASISEGYIPQPAIRLALYRRILRARNGSELRDLALELDDRFGTMPSGVAFLLALARLRLLGATRGIARIVSGEDQTVIEGDIPRLAPLLLAAGGWLLTEGRAFGPGGSPALVDLASRIDDGNADESKKEGLHRDVFQGGEI
ncbi:transcription-repair coupling factor [Aminirod propionatiphilus]|uniref:Transcription-repair coupling factor n=1 Tax=Aminirod propionatiphilus TaxID=3415223 RepID=A0ACD1DSH2_9BACT|nr:transcription-repair coupling factor [Synergistota bacterium]